MFLLKSVIHGIFRIIIIALFARAIMSWFIRDYTHPVAEFLYRFTEPILTPMRRIFDKFGLNQGMFDFSFLATFFAVQILDSLIHDILTIIQARMLY